MGVLFCNVNLQMQPTTKPNVTYALKLNTVQNITYIFTDKFAVFIGVSKIMISFGFKIKFHKLQLRSGMSFIPEDADAGCESACREGSL